MTRAKMSVALLLTLAAGCVDIVGFLSIYPTFTAHMTGVTVHVGQKLASGAWPDVVLLFGVLLAFVLGSIVGRTVIELAYFRNVRSAAAVALAIETALILGVALPAEKGPLTAPATFLLAAAMGVQTATLTRVGPLTVHTTFVTGMLNKLAQLLSHALFLSLGAFGHRIRQTHDRRRTLRQAAFIASVWFAYLAGAVAGTFINARWEVRSLLIPCMIVGGIAIADVFRPLLLEDEQDQPER